MKANEKNYSYHSSTVKEMFGMRWPSIICAIPAIIADLIAFIYLLYASDMSYAVYPMLLMIVGILFLVASIFVDYRYKYSVGIISAYTGISTLLLLIFLFSTVANVDVTMSALAYVILMLCHILGYVSTIVTVFKSNHQDKKSRLFGIIGSTVVSLIAIISIVYTSVFGFFGQNIGIFDNKMVLVYNYDEESGTYEASDVLYGRGNVVQVPKIFNGKEVKLVSCELFTKKAIKEVKLLSDVTLTDLEILKGENSYFTSVISPEPTAKSVDHLRNQLFEYAKKSTKNALNLCNKITFDSSATDEVAISFMYDANSFPSVAGDVLAPTIFLKKGESFSFDSYKDKIPYFAYIEPSTNEELVSAYYDGRGYFLNTPYTENGKVLDGLKIEENTVVKPLSFERVYLLNLTNGNDTAYTVPAEISSVIKNGDKGKLVKHSSLDSYLNTLALLPNEDRGGAFTATYRVDGSVLTRETLLSSLESKNNATIVPTWQIVPPVINNVTGHEREYVYGDGEIELEISASCKLDIKYVIYSDKLENGTSGELNQSSYKINALPKNAGEYRVEVYVDDPSTSLDDNLDVRASKQISLRIIKKELSLSWSIPENAIFNGSEHSINVSVGSGIVNNDTVNVQREIKDLTTSLSGAENPVNAGEYEITASFVDSALNDLYVMKNPQASFTVSKANATVEWSGTTFTYNGTIQYPTVTVTGVNNTPLSANEQTRNTAYAGTYTKTFALADALDRRNYNYNDQITYTINKKDITVNWGETAYDYNALVQGPTVVGVPDGELCGSDTLLLSQITYTGRETDAGTYTVVASASFPDYNIINTTCDYEIKPIDLTITVNDTQMVYYGSVCNSFRLDFSGLAGADKLVEVLEIDYGEAGTAVNASTYEIELSVKKELGKFKNYNVTLLESNGRATLTIDKATTYITLSATEFIYNGNIQVPIATVLGVNNTRLENTVTPNKTSINADTYEATVTLKFQTDIQNYKHQQTGYTYEILKRDVTVSISNTNHVYNKEQFDGFKPQISNLAPTDSLSDVIASFNFGDAQGQINAGSYDITLTALSYGSKIDNYNVNDGEPILDTATLYITPASCEATISNVENLVYNGQEQLPTVTVESVYNETLSASFTVSTDKTSAGVHTLTVTLTDSLEANNYKLKKSSFTYQIAKLSVTASWNSGTYVYSGSSQGPSASIEGVNGTLTTNVTYDKTPIDAGKYVATVNLSQTDKVNYTVINSTQAFEISRYTVTASWENTSYVYNGFNQLPSASFTSLQGNKVELVITQADDIIDVGTYTVSAIIGDQSYSNNYTLANPSTSFEITKRPITISVSDQSFVYSSTTPKIELVANNLATTDTLSEVVSKFHFGEAENAIDVGTYQIVLRAQIEGEKHGNYLINNGEEILDTATLTIEKKDISIVWAKGTFTYNGRMQAPTAVLSENVDITTSISGGDAINVGKYKISATTANQNYNLLNTEDEFEIIPKEVEVIWGELTFTYDGEEKTPSAKIIGVNGEIVLSVKVEGAHTEVGRYTAVCEADDSNYKLTNNTARFEIVENTENEEEER